MRVFGRWQIRLGLFLLFGALILFTTGRFGDSQTDTLTAARPYVIDGLTKRTRVSSPSFLTGRTLRAFAQQLSREIDRSAGSNDTSTKPTRGVIVRDNLVARPAIKLGPENGTGEAAPRPKTIRPSKPRLASNSAPPARLPLRPQSHARQTPPLKPPAVDRTTTASVSAPPRERALEERSKQSVRTAVVQASIPTRIFVDTARLVKVEIRRPQPDDTLAAASEIRDQLRVITQPTVLDEDVFVELQADGMKITPGMTTWQALDPVSPSLWTWQIEAAKPGSKELLFIVRHKLKVDGREKVRTATNFPKRIVVLAVEGNVIDYSYDWFRRHSAALSGAAGLIAVLLFAGAAVQNTGGAIAEGSRLLRLKVPTTNREASSSMADEARAYDTSESGVEPETNDDGSPGVQRS